MRDLQAGTTALVNRASGPAGAAPRRVERPAISADGRAVAFISTPTTSRASDADGVADIFVRDLRAGTTTLVSRASGPAGGGAAAGSSASAISATGASSPSIRTPTTSRAEDADGVADIFVRDSRPRRPPW